ncbi:MAG: hypothetical protein KA313_09665 [Pseudarcicella sp.]|nr:hypothetical protein [Pseudarcicella sp.]MBP6411355.1 hypothetical protein [Pseudarcicella sp.]
MQIQDLSKYNFEVQTKNLPINIYGIRILDLDKNQNHDIVISHNGYCPNICTEREQSNYNDYLSNLESSVLSVFEKGTKIKNYTRLFEVMTNEKGELYHLLKSVD